MAYATSNGTLYQMISALAAFALANGWSARTTAAHRYWSILGYNSKSPLSQTRIQQIMMAESSAGANVITGGTASATNGVAADAEVAPGVWIGSTTRETRWTYDLGSGVTKNVVEAKIQFDTELGSYKWFSVEFSDDGSNWSVLKSFAPNVSSDFELFTGLWTNTDWPLTPDGDNYYEIIVDEQSSDTGYDEVTGGAYPVDPLYVVHINLGKDRVLPLDGSSELYLPTLTIDEWHFFADTTISNHLNVAFRITVLGKTYWYHFSMGEIDKRGMSHNGVVYATTSRMMPYAENPDSGGTSAGWRHHTLYRSGFMMGGIAPTGIISLEAIGDSSVQYAFTQTGGAFPVPDDGFWPDRASTHYEGSQLVPTLLPTTGSEPNSDQFLLNSGRPPALGGIGWNVLAHPTTGFVTLGTLPFILANADSQTPNAEFCAMGEYPNVRSVRLDSIAVGGEITVGGDTWKCFPLLRKTNVSEMLNNPRVAQSGPAGIAYKKV